MSETMEMPVDAVYAGSIRTLGVEVDPRIPDCAWVPRSAMRIDTKGRADGDKLQMMATVTFDEPFRWVEIPITIKANGS